MQIHIRKFFLANEFEFKANTNTHRQQIAWNSKCIYSRLDGTRPICIAQSCRRFQPQGWNARKCLDGVAECTSGRASNDSCISPKCLRAFRALALCRQALLLCCCCPALGLLLEAPKVSSHCLFIAADNCPRGGPLAIPRDQKHYLLKKVKDSSFAKVTYVFLQK